MVAPTHRILRRPCRRTSNPYNSWNEIVGTTNRSIDAIPSAWLRRNVFHPCDGGRLPRAIYWATVVCPTSMPSLRSSPWIRGAPQNGFATLISRISCRTSSSVFGRPPWGLDLHRQYCRNPARCQRITVSGLMIVRAPRIQESKRYNPANTSRSLLLSVSFFGDVRRRILSWWRSVRFSASSEARDRNHPTSAYQISLQTLNIGQKHHPIRSRAPTV